MAISTLAITDYRNRHISLPNITISRANLFHSLRHLCKPQSSNSTMFKDRTLEIPGATYMPFHPPPPPMDHHQKKVIYIII